MTITIPEWLVDSALRAGFGVLILFAIIGVTLTVMMLMNFGKPWR